MNWSTLRYIATSPKLLKWRIEHPEPESEALRLGRAIHCALLEPEAFPKRWVASETCAAKTKTGDGCKSQGTLYAEGKWYCKVKGHAPQDAGAVPDGMESIAPDQLELAKACAQAVREHAPAMRLLKGAAFEQELEWTHAETGIECRGRVDALLLNGLADLKSTRRETVREFVRDAAENLYYAQVAWYFDGAIKAGRIPADSRTPYIISVSTSEPYDVAVYQLHSVALEAGRILYRDLLLRYQKCVATGLWPGIAPDVLTLDLPIYAKGMNGSEESEEF